MNNYGEEYFQKSYHLLYPLVGIIKNTPWKPETYLFFKDKVDEDINNFHLLVYFKNKSDLFHTFSQTNLKFENLVSIHETDKGFLYIYDLVKYSMDIAHFLYGDYSLISAPTKVKIMKFHQFKSAGLNPDRFAEIALYPEKYYSVYAKQLEMSVSQLKGFNKELVPNYDESKEIFSKESLNIWKTEEKFIFL